ncbi:MAG: hypothetical protein AAFZ15_12355 [Bacteroidota bacterium]
MDRTKKIEEIKHLVIKNKIRKAISQIKQLADMEGNKKIQKESIALLGRLKQLEHNEDQGVLTRGEISIEQNKIRSATLHILEWMDEASSQAQIQKPRSNYSKYFILSTVAIILAILLIIINSSNETTGKDSIPEMAQSSEPEQLQSPKEISDKLFNVNQPEDSVNNNVQSGADSLTKSPTNVSIEKNQTETGRNTEEKEKEVNQPIDEKDTTQIKHKDPLAILSILEGTVKDKSSKIFEIIVQNNTSEKILLKSFNLSYQYLPGTTSLPSESEIIVPLTKYVLEMPIDVLKPLKESLVITAYRPIAVAAHDITSFQVQLHYDLGKGGYHPSGGWDIKYALSLTTSIEHELVIIPENTKWRGQDE